MQATSAWYLSSIFQYFLLIHICIRIVVVDCLSGIHIHIHIHIVPPLWIAWAYFTDNKFKKR